MLELDGADNEVRRAENALSRVLCILGKSLNTNRTLIKQVHFGAE